MIFFLTKASKTIQNMSDTVSNLRQQVSGRSKGIYARLLQTEEGKNQRVKNNLETLSEGALHQSNQELIQKIKNNRMKIYNFGELATKYNKKTNKIASLEDSKVAETRYKEDITGGPEEGIKIQV